MKERFQTLQVIGKYLVSTVELTLPYDPRATSFNPPQCDLFYYETIVFKGSKEVYVKLYKTKEKALKGHERYIKRIETKVAKEEVAV